MKPLRTLPLIATLMLLVVAGCTPRPLVRLAARTFPGCRYEVRTSEKAVALTIDDGPDATTTPALLQLLKKYNAQATFFLISDNVKGNDSLVTAMLQQGHEIGNHFSGKESSIRLSVPMFNASFQKADSVLRAFAPMKWVRPGSGRYNQRMIQAFNEKQYQCALGSVHPFDPQLPFAWYGTSVVLGEVYPGAVIVLHDGGYKGRNTEKVLMRVLPALAKRGYRVTTLSALAALETAKASAATSTPAPSAERER